MRFPWSKSPTQTLPARTFTSRRVFATKADGERESTQLRDNEFGVLYDQGRAIEPPLDPLLLLNLQDSNETHTASIAAKATDACGRGYELLPREGVEEPDQMERAVTLRRLELLCPDFPFGELLNQAAYEMDAIGWGSWEVLRSSDGQIASAYPLPAHTLRVTKDADVFVQVRDPRVRYFRRFGSRLDEDLDGDRGTWGPRGSASSQAAEVITFRRYSARSSWYSVPRWLAVLPTLAELSAIQAFNSSFFESSGVLDKLIFIMSRESVSGAIDQIEAMLKEARGRSHGAVVTDLPEGAKVHTEDLAEAIKGGEHFLDQRRDLTRAVLIAHQVPAYRVGWAEAGALGGNAAKEMLRAYRWGSVEPIQEAIEHRLAATLFGPLGFGLRDWRFAFKDLDWDETEFSLKLATEGAHRGILTPNEAREAIGYDRKDDPLLDQHYAFGKLMDASQEAVRTIDILRDLRQQLEIALSAEQEQALAVAETALLGAAQGQEAEPQPQQAPPAN